jgi:predicted DNA-binding ribbon-helix-helix protein
MPWGNEDLFERGGYFSRNIVVSGRRTSMRLEAPLWAAFEEIAQREGCTVNDLCDKVDARRGRMGLTGAVRVALVRYYRDRTAELQHRRRPNAIDGPVRRSGLEAWC